MEKIRRVMRIGIVYTVVSVALVACSHEVDNKSGSVMPITAEANKTKAVDNISISELDEGALSSLVENPFSHSDALYVDGVDNVEDLKRSADLIIWGEAISQEQLSSVAVAVRVKVTTTFKGKEFDEVVIHQIGQLNGDHVLVPGEQYYLFLGKQTDDSANSFFIKGGDQGWFDVKDGILKPKDSTIEQSIQEQSLSNKMNSFESWLVK